MTSLSKYANCAQQQFPLQRHKTLPGQDSLHSQREKGVRELHRKVQRLALAGRVIKFKVGCLLPANPFPASYFLTFEAHHYCVSSTQ